MVTKGRKQKVLPVTTVPSTLWLHGLIFLSFPQGGKDIEILKGLLQTTDKVHFNEPTITKTIHIFRLKMGWGWCKNTIFLLAVTCQLFLWCVWALTCPCQDAVQLAVNVTPPRLFVLELDNSTNNPACTVKSHSNQTTALLFCGSLSTSSHYLLLWPFSEAVLGAFWLDPWRKCHRCCYLQLQGIKCFNISVQLTIRANI